MVACEQGTEARKILDCSESLGIGETTLTAKLRSLQAVHVQLPTELQRPSAALSRDVQVGLGGHERADSGRVLPVAGDHERGHPLAIVSWHLVVEAALSANSRARAASFSDSEPGVGKQKQGSGKRHGHYVSGIFF